MKAKEYSHNIVRTLDVKSFPIEEVDAALTFFKFSDSNQHNMMVSKGSIEFPDGMFTLSMFRDMNIYEIEGLSKTFYPILVRPSAVDQYIQDGILFDNASYVTDYGEYGDGEFVLAFTNGLCLLDSSGKPYNTKVGVMVISDYHDVDAIKNADQELEFVRVDDNGVEYYSTVVDMRPSDFIEYQVSQRIEIFEAYLPIKGKDE